MNGASSYFASNSYYDLAAWEWTAPGTYTVSVTDSYGDGCTCTVFAYRSYAPTQQANDVVFAVEIDGLPEDTVVNYTINYEFYNVLMHQNMVVPDSVAGTDTTAPRQVCCTPQTIPTQDICTMHGILRTFTRYLCQKTTVLQ